MGRPEDAWAFANFVHDRYPDVKLHCFWALQATSFTQGILHPGLVLDPRLSKYFPQSLLDKMKPSLPHGAPRNLLSRRHFNWDGALTWNIYDIWRSQGRTLNQSLTTWLAQLLPIAASSKVPKQARCKQYFEMTLKLFNDMGSKPVLVIMPYQPRALAAFEAVGWMKKEQRLHHVSQRPQEEVLVQGAQLPVAQELPRRPNAFYDGAHVTVKNARLIVAQAVKEAPGCFHSTHPPRRRCPPGQAGGVGDHHVRQYAGAALADRPAGRPGAAHGGAGRLGGWAWARRNAQAARSRTGAHELAAALAGVGHQRAPSSPRTAPTRRI